MASVVREAHGGFAQGTRKRPRFRGAKGYHQRPTRTSLVPRGGCEKDTLGRKTIRSPGAAVTVAYRKPASQMRPPKQASTVSFIPSAPHSLPSPQSRPRHLPPIPQTV